MYLMLRDDFILLTRCLDRRTLIVCHCYVVSRHFSCSRPRPSLKTFYWHHVAVCLTTSTRNTITHLFAFILFQCCLTVWCAEQTLDRELQKRLTAFERAGVENYLHRKRYLDENKIDKKADTMLQK